MKKFYAAQNANRYIGGVAFILTQIVAGTVCGVYATEDPDEIKAIDKEVSDKRGVEPITEAEYEAELKKKVLNSPTWTPSNVVTRTQTAPMKGRGAVVVSNSGPEPEEAEPVKIVSAPVEKVEDALKLDQVAPAVVPQPAPTKKGKK